MPTTVPDLAALDLTPHGASPVTLIYGRAGTEVGRGEMPLPPESLLQFQADMLFLVQVMRRSKKAQILSFLGYPSTTSITKDDAAILAHNRIMATWWPPLVVGHIDL